MIKIKKNKVKSKKGSIKVRLLVIPIIVIILSIFAIGAVSSLMVRNSLISQMKENGEFLLKQFSSRIEDNTNSLDVINDSIENDIINASKVIEGEGDELTNEKITRLAEDLNITEINYFDENSMIIYSNIAENINWQPDSDHALFSFASGNETELIEDIREDAVSGDFVKYGAIKTSNGRMIQAGINANYINDLTKEFGYQKLIDDLATNEEITYALFIDNDLKASAHSNKDRIGTDLSDDKGAISAIKDQEIFSNEYTYDVGNVPVYDMVYPVVIDGEQLGAVNIGFSMENVKSAIKRNITTIAIGGLLVILILGFILYYTANYAIKAINKLKVQMNTMADGDFTIDQVKDKSIKNDDQVVKWTLKI
ncbi:hypothetical protein [Senegalia sp. (in: firmicutes)]|uniref:hypothetical protein n=2 Tax=Senegalia sp. (in: firmicutes) TaxID=1924098 RepID=UPI003F9A5BA2